MNPQQPGPAGAAQQQPVRIPMYRPEQMRTLEILSDSDKEKYERGLRGLWDAMENNDATSAAHLQAKAKIVEFSRMVYTKVATMRRQTMAQANQPGQLGQPQNPALAAQRAAAAQQRPGGMPANAAKPAINGGAAAAGQPRPVAPQGAQPGISQQVLQHVNSLRIVPPASVANDPDKAQAFKTETKTRYIRALQLMEQATKKMQHMQNLVNTRNAKGNPLSPEEQQKFAQEMEGMKKSHAEAKKYVEGIRHQSAEALRQEAAGAGQAGGQGAAAAQAARTQHTQAPGNPMQAATASVNAAMDAAKNLQSGAANRQTGAVPKASSTSGPTATPTTQTTAPAAQSHPAPAPQQPQVKVEPGSHPQPPPVNTALAAATVQQHPATASTPTQNSARIQTPQTATPTTAGPAGAARPLSHQAAMSLANRHSTSSGSAGSQQGSTGAGPTTTPGSAGANANTPQGGHSHAHPTPTAGAMHVSKMPIPKQLPEKAVQIPQPVATAGGVQPGRPTLGNGVGMSGGTMNQPVIQKNPAYIFETEGDHIMNKKKLDELVRQVCGGGPAGQDGNYLTPDVEESVLQVADNFIDNVLQSACRLAKERGSKVLEIRDIQLVLERVYNIRIPGFTSDELRTVRKPQPSAAWLSKISAVQAAKVTRDEK